MEQGELEASPDGRSSSPAGRQSQPRSSHTPDYKPDPEEEDEAGDDASHERQDDNEDGLDIKPPQVQANRKDRHKHKHREDRKRDKERDKLNRNRERQSKVKPHEHEREKPPKERRDDRDPGRREHEKQQEKEAEAKRREKSNRERERLERLERERHRLEREHKERLQLEQERLLRAERERERLDKAERQSRQRGHDGDSRSGRRQPPLPPATRHDVERRRAKDKPAYANRDRRVPDVAAAADRGRRGVEPSAERLTRRVVIESVVERERPRSRSPVHSSKDRYDRDRREDARYRKGFRDQDLQRHRQTEVVDLLEEEDDEDERPHQLSSVPSKVQKFPPDEPVLVDEDLGEEGEHSGSDTERESETDTDSASDSESESGESGSSSEHLRSHRQHHGEAAEAEEQEDQDDMEHMHHSPDKYRSKFDDAPEEEEMDEQEDDLDLEDTDLDSPRPSEADDEANYIEDLPPESPVELKPDLPPYLPAIQGCRNVEEFHCLNRIEEGTYGVVYRARDKKTDQIVALKRLKMEKEKEGFPITSLREINTLLKSQHNNIVTVREIVVGSNMDKIYIVMDYVEHDLKSLMETMKEPFMIGEVKTLLRQLLKGVAHLHDNWIIHRDLKTSNLLLSHAGILKIGDFGLAREYGSPLKHYTPIVVTLWYRAPELLLGTKKYSTPIDMWSVGCIFAEFLTKKPLFPGKSEIDELNRIFKELGTPNEKIWPGVGELPAMKKCTFTEYPYNQLRNRFGSLLTDKGFDLLNTFLTYNPERRISAEDALKHDYYQESPKPIDTSMFPTWPAKSEMPRRQSGGNSPRPPSGGKAYDRLMGEDDDVQGFHMSTAAKGAAACGPGFSLKF